MKTEYLSRGWAPAVISGLLTFGTAELLRSAFGLNVSEALPLYLAAVWLLAWMASELPWGWLLAPLGAGGMSLSLLAAGRLSVSVESFLFTVTQRYHEAYGCGRIRWSDDDLSTGNQTAVLLMIAMGAATYAAWAMRREKHTPGLLVLGVAPLAVCAAVPAAMPGDVAIVLQLSGMVLTLLCAGIRGRRERDPAVLVTMAAAPVVLALAVIVSAVPRDPGAFTGPLSFQDSLSWMADFWSIFRPRDAIPSNGQLVAGQYVKLTEVGVRSPRTTPMMQVDTSYKGMLYLREDSYDSYDGTRWAVSHQAWNRDNDYISRQDRFSVSIRTYNTHSVRFVPCYPVLEGDQQLVRGMMPHADEYNKRSYTFHAATPIRELSFRTGKVTVNDNAVLTLRAESIDDFRAGKMDQFLQLPTATCDAARQVLRQVDPPGRNLMLGSAAEADYMYRYALRIGEYVRASAAYDLNTRRMPAGEEDFALWFLRDSATGYCVHFATAAVVLLRSAGIPARYVTGYVVDTASTTTVRQKNAHAWVEYWLPGVGWMMLDPTPGYAGGEDAQNPTESDRPSSEDAPEPSSPQESQRPSETPSDPADSSSQRPGGASDANPSAPGGQSGQPVPWTVLGQVLRQLLLWAAVAAGVVLQWKARVALRMYRMHRGDPNRQALTRWKYCRRSGALIRMPVPERLRQLAEKACFSAHTLRPEELAEFDGFLWEARDRMKRKPWFLQAVYRLVLAEY